MSKRLSIDTTQDAEDFVDGCLLFGTGGGGDPLEGIRILKEALHQDLPLGWVDANTIDDGALTATIYRMGSIAPRAERTTALLEALHLDDAQGKEAAPDAVLELGRYLDRDIDCLVAVELGAINSPMPVVTAATLGIPLVNGDYSGRAAPEEMQTTPHIAGYASHPFVSIDRWGNTAIVPRTANPYMLERIGKMLSVAGVDGTTIASTTISGRGMKEIVIPDTLSTCLAVGRACRIARDDGEDPVDAAVAATGGYRLFDGVIRAKEWEDTDGYMVGTLEISGKGRSKGQTLRIWLKNENHISWLDDSPWVCSPDLISVVAAKTGRAYTNTVIREGAEVSVVGIPGPPSFRQDSVLDDATGPRHYGFDIDYRPIEDLV